MRRLIHFFGVLAVMTTSHPALSEKLSHQPDQDSQQSSPSTIESLIDNLGKSPTADDALDLSTLSSMKEKLEVMLALDGENKELADKLAKIDELIRNKQEALAQKKDDNQR